MTGRNAHRSKEIQIEALRLLFFFTLSEAQVVDTPLSREVFEDHVDPCARPLFDLAENFDERLPAFKEALEEARRIADETGYASPEPFPKGYSRAMLLGLAAVTGDRAIAARRELEGEVAHWWQQPQKRGPVYRPDALWGVLMVEPKHCDGYHPRWEW